MLSKALAVSALFWMVSPVHGQSNTPELSTLIPTVAKPLDGHEYRPAVAAANLSAQHNDVDSAWASLKPVLAYCDTKTSDAQHTFVSVADDIERKEAELSHQRPPPVVLVDRACPAAYKTAAFLAVQARDIKRAFTNLDRAESLAPYWADTYIEHGYLLRVLGDLENSLRNYRRAWSLAEQYPSSSGAKGAALRGIGFVLTEQRDLDGAQEAYEQSLKVDPSSDLAHHELDYIAKQRLRK